MTTRSLSEQSEKENRKTAFEQLYNEYSKRLFGLAKSILGNFGNHQDAEDAVGETFSRILEALPTPKDIYAEDVQRFIVMTLRNICINMINRKKREMKIMFPSESIDEFKVSLKDLTDIVEEKAALKQVYNELDKLPEKYSYPFILHFTYNLSYSQIGILLDISVLTARQRTCRVRKIIRESLKGVTFDD